LNSIEITKLVVSIYASVGSLAAALAALLTVKTTKETLDHQIKKNKIAMRPLPVIEEKYVSGEMELSYPTIPHLYNWSSGKFDLNDFGSEKIYLTLFNAGHGIAKNLKIKKEILNIDSFLKGINNPEPYTYINFSENLDENMNDTNYLEINHLIMDPRTNEKSFRTDQIRIKNLQIEKVNYLGGRDEGPYNIEIPQAFIAFYNLYLMSPSEFEQTDKPKLYIYIESEDAEGKCYPDEFLIYLDNMRNLKTERNQLSFEALFRAE